MSMSKNLSDLVDEWCDQNKCHSFEGDSGLKKFEKLLQALGYERHNFRFGEVIEVFLSDNSGAVNAIIDWITERNEPSWIASIEAELNEDCA